jgi:hypothetical protein
MPEARLADPKYRRRRTHWLIDGSDAMFANYAGRYDTYRLVVEEAGKAWEWIVWPVGHPSRAQSGQSHTAIRATRAAIAAAHHIDQASHGATKDLAEPDNIRTGFVK